MEKHMVFLLLILVSSPQQKFRHKLENKGSYSKHSTELTKPHHIGSSRENGFLTTDLHLPTHLSVTLAPGPDWI